MVTGDRVETYPFLREIDNSPELYPYGKFSSPQDAVPPSPLEKIVVDTKRRNDIANVLNNPTLSHICY